MHAVPWLLSTALNDIIENHGKVVIFKTFCFHFYIWSKNQSPSLSMSMLFLFLSFLFLKALDSEKNNNDNQIPKAKTRQSVIDEAASSTQPSYDSHLQSNPHRDRLHIWLWPVAVQSVTDVPELNANTVRSHVARMQSFSFTNDTQRCTCIDS